MREEPKVVPALMGEPLRERRLLDDAYVQAYLCISTHRPNQPPVSRASRD